MKPEKLPTEIKSHIESYCGEINIFHFWYSNDTYFIVFRDKYKDLLFMTYHKGIFVINETLNADFMKECFQ